MVFVVERYLPGLSRSDLLRGLSGLEQAMEGMAETRAVRYLGSTIVLGDEACFCQFEGPSEAAVAEANREAGLSFDRIVPAVTVAPAERGTPMTVSPSIPHTVEMRRSRLVGVVTAVALVAALLTWALLTFAVDTGTETSMRSKSAPAAKQAAAVKQFENGIGKIGQAQQNAAVLDALGPRLASTLSVRSLMDLTPGDLAGGGLGGYALPSRQSGPTLAEVLASMSPESRRYVTTLMRLTFRQLAEGAAGYP
jgi:hypothetical protein